MRVFADQVVCELADQILRASGKSTRVQFDNGFVLDCKRLTFDIRKQRGVASGGVRFVENSPGLKPSSSAQKIKTAKRLEFEIKNDETLSLSVQE